MIAFQNTPLVLFLNVITPWRRSLDPLKVRKLNVRRGVRGVRAVQTTGLKTGGWDGRCIKLDFAARSPSPRVPCNCESRAFRRDYTVGATEWDVRGPGPAGVRAHCSPADRTGAPGGAIRESWEIVLERWRLNVYYKRKTTGAHSCPPDPAVWLPTHRSVFCNFLRPLYGSSRDTPRPLTIRLPTIAESKQDNSKTYIITYLDKPFSS